MWARHHLKEVRASSETRIVTSNVALSSELERTVLVINQKHLIRVKSNKMNPMAVGNDLKQGYHLPDQKETTADTLQRHFCELEKRVDKYFDNL